MSSSETNASRNHFTQLQAYGLVILIITTILAIYLRCATDLVLFVIYGVFGIGLALTLPSSAERSGLQTNLGKNSFKFAGAVVVPLFLIIYNPVKRFGADSCPLPTTNVTIIIHGKEGSQDVNIKDQGQVVMDVISKGQLICPINENGEATFINLQVGDSVRINVKFSEPYKTIHPDSVYIIKPNEAIYITAALGGLGFIQGAVVFKGRYLQGVIIKLVTKNGILLDTTNQTGDYRFLIPEKSQCKQYPIWFNKGGFVTKHYTATPETGQELNVDMEK